MLRGFLFAAAALAPTHGAQILLAGDSWTGGGSVFVDTFRKHGDTRTIQNIGVGGSTCQGWANEGLFGNLNRLLTAVRDPEVEHVWFICGGNDALGNLLLCTPQEECVARLIESSRANVRKILQAVHEANPRVKVSGFGYDLFPFGAIHCNAVSIGLLPACLGNAECVNREMFKIQGIYDEMAAEFSNMDASNLLGSLQAARGVPGASVGHPKVDEFSPSDTFAIDCIHPNREGYEIIFEAFYEKYWSHSKPRVAGNATAPPLTRYTAPEDLDERTSAMLWKAYTHGLKLMAAANATAQ